MIQQQIRDGLYFQVSPMAQEAECNAALQRSDRHVSLTCRFTPADTCADYHPAARSYQIIFKFDLPYLQSFSAAGDGFVDGIFPEHQQQAMCCNSQLLLHEILSCELQGIFRNMFLESKALALLLCFSKSHAVFDTACSTCKFLSRPMEKEKLFKARAIILENLSDPPTIPELSLRTGINQCYLKKGFKELFGTTVYDFVQEQRMQKAKMLLVTNGHSVAEVAQAVGFSSTGNFSQAFKRITGIFPSALQRN
ncbi:MAG: AraC family transcriptional regulator [Chitinophagales bacterium]|nr:AraC family transcriptional regulator [Chitinophagales bacterium]